MTLAFIIAAAGAAFAERVTYTYDATGRLVQENENGTVTNYVYDKVGNLLSVTVGNYQALPPTLQGVDPDIFISGGEYYITVTGQNLVTTRSLSTNNANAIISNIAAQDTAITATLTVLSGTPPGPANINVTTEYGAASLPIVLHKALLTPAQTLLIPTNSATFGVSLTPAASRAMSVNIVNNNSDILQIQPSAIIPAGGSGTFPVKAQIVGTGTFTIGDTSSSVIVLDSVEADSSPVSVSAMPILTMLSSPGVSVSFPFSVDSLAAKPVGVTWSSVANAAVVSAPVSVMIANN